MAYTSDLTDLQWEQIAYCFPPPTKLGRPRKHAPRSIFNAMLYVSKTGCQWRNLPHDFPPWKTVHDYFRKWTRGGLVEKLHSHLVEHVRLREQKQRAPSAAIMDSQSVKSTETSSMRGYDAGKKVNGIKRHILVDTLGLIMLLMILPANIQDRDGAKSLLEKTKSAGKRAGLQQIWADGGYAGELVKWVKNMLGFALEIVKRTDHQKGFVVVKKRWIVERTFAWLGRWRRLARHYERKTDSAEAMVYLGMIKLMLVRLEKS